MAFSTCVYRLFLHILVQLLQYNVVRGLREWMNPLPAICALLLLISPTFLSSEVPRGFPSSLNIDFHNRPLYGETVKRRPEEDKEIFAATCLWYHDWQDSALTCCTMQCLTFSVHTLFLFLPPFLLKRNLSNFYRVQIGRYYNRYSPKKEGKKRAGWPREIYLGS